MPASLPRRAYRPLTAFVLLALGTAGCAEGARTSESRDHGSGPDGSYSWEAIGAPAVDALHDAPSVTIGLTRQRDGRMTKGTVRIGRDKECRAEMTTGRGGTVDVIRTRDGAAYLRLSEAQIRSRPGSRTPAQVDADVRLFSDQWLKGDPSAPQVRQTLQLCDIRNMIPKLPATAVEAPGTVTADGRRVVFTARDQEETLTVHIGPGRNPTLHKMERTGGESPFTAVFSGYGEPVGATHPAAEDVLTQNEVRSLFRDTDSAPARDGNR